jgi:hypothetical protein
MSLIPHEIALGEVFMPPLLVAGTLAVVATVMTVHLLNRYRLSRYFYYAPLVFVALTVIYTVVIGTFLIRI